VGEKLIDDRLGGKLGNVLREKKWEGGTEETF